VPRLLAYLASRDFVPLYAVYALLFADHGVEPARISLLFVIWSVTGFVCEVPSGAWADSFDRRRLLVLSAAVYAVGFGSWTLRPDFAGFALGFVCWGISSALMSGTFESLVYDELVERGQPQRYPSLIGRAHSTAMLANLAATASAALLVHLGGYALVGWTLRPDAARRAGGVTPPPRRTPCPGAGVADGRADGVRRVLPAGRPRPRTVGSILCVGAVLVSTGALATPYVGFVAIGIGYGLLNNAMLVGEARLQQTITGPARVALLGVPAFLVGVAVTRWLPGRSGNS
jgi:MFS family permease